MSPDALTVQISRLGTVVDGMIPEGMNIKQARREFAPNHLRGMHLDAMHC